MSANIIYSIPLTALIHDTETEREQSTCSLTLQMLYSDKLKAKSSLHVPCIESYI